METRLPHALGLVVAQYLSWIGTGVTLVAIPLFVLSQSGSAIAAGLAGLAGSLPLVLVGMVGGVVVDRYGARRVSVIADLLAALAVILIPASASLFGFSLLPLLILIALRASFDSPADTARMALVGTFLDRTASTRGVGKLNSLYLAAPRLGVLLGPVAAGLISLLGPIQIALYLDGLSFLAAAVLILITAPHDSARSSGGSAAQEWRGALRGLKIIRASPVVLMIASVVVITNFLDEPLSGVLLPVFARDELGDIRAGAFLVAAFGAGALIGTLAYPALKRIAAMNDSRIFMLSFLIIAGARAALLFSENVVAATLVMIIIGMASGPLNPIIATAVQAAVPASQQGVVWGAFGSFAFAAAPLGQAVAGLSAQNVGVMLTLVWQLFIYAGVVGFVIRAKSVRLLGVPSLGAIVTAESRAKS